MMNEHLKREGNRLYLEESGMLLAEVTFPENSEGVYVIDHTFVDPKLRGKGMASKLVESVLEIAKKENVKLLPTCSYAIKWFEAHSEAVCGISLLQKDE